MRVLVIGANGQIGHQIVEKLQDTEHEPVAMVRKEEQTSQFEDKGIKTVVADLEQDFTKAYDGVDAVVFAAGSGGSTGPDRTIVIDQEGAIEAVENARDKGIKHFLIVSSIGSDKPKEADDKIKHYMYAKHRADQHLIQSGVPYTIVRPGLLTNDGGSGKVNLKEGESVYGEVPREDVASVITQAVVRNQPENNIYYLIEGDTPIEDAF